MADSVPIDNNSIISKDERTKYHYQFRSRYNLLLIGNSLLIMDK